MSRPARSTAPLRTGTAGPRRPLVPRPPGKSPSYPRRAGRQLAGLCLAQLLAGVRGRAALAVASVVHPNEPVTHSTRGNTTPFRGASLTMATTLNKRLYTAEATVHGGRDGHGTSSDGVLDLDIRPPKELGGPGGATNPEQLFALGYGACFQSAMGVVGRRRGVDTSGSTVTARVSLGPIDGGAYGLAVELEVEIPGIDRQQAEEIVQAAHEVC